ncbi:MAG: EAL domain-containing protein [Pseudomonadota bacterium]
MATSRRPQHANPPNDRHSRALMTLVWTVAALALAGSARSLITSGSWTATLATIVMLACLAGVSLAAARHRTRSQELAQQNSELFRRLNVDQLTGLMNRSAFHSILDDPRLAEHEMLIVLFFDLDRFKEVNDTLGHKVGDDLLKQVAERALAVAGQSIALARLGGDEFAAIIAWDTDCLPETYGAAMVHAIGEPFLINGMQVEIGASVGLAVGDPSRLSGSELLRRADLAMYTVKGAPKGGFRMFDDALDRHEMRESSVRVELGKAMVDDLFSLHYQPLVDARTGRLSSAEALLRSHAPALRDVSPHAMIVTAESSGQINALTDWTLETALVAAARLETVPIAVNISPIYFRQPEFVSRLMDKLLIARVRPEQLIVEITENVLIENVDAARRSIERMREMGVKVFLDDFGTGYSSLSYLQNFELDGLKLDKSFLRSVGDRRKTNQIIRSVIDFGHGLDMRVVVEGVESDWQVRLLQLLGCDLLQGFEIGMPMTLEDLLRYKDRSSASAAGRPAEAAAGLAFGPDSKKIS